MVAVVGLHFYPLAFRSSDVARTPTDDGRPANKCEPQGEDGTAPRGASRKAWWFFDNWICDCKSRTRFAVKV